MIKHGWLSKLFIMVLSASICLDLNKATVNQLINHLPMVGYKKAQAIIAYRKCHHGFTSIYELEAVSGLGWRYMQKHVETIESVFCKLH